MSAHPGIGEWFRIHAGDRFQVVAVDDDEGTLEIQYTDGTIEALYLADWEAHAASGDIEQFESTEDWQGSSTFEHDHGDSNFALNHHFDSGAHVAGGLDGLDLFDSNDSYGYH
jgi:hypothetical protein